MKLNKFNCNGLVILLLLVLVYSLTLGSTRIVEGHKNKETIHALKSLQKNIYQKS